MDRRKLAVRIMCGFLAALMMLGSASLIISLLAA